MRFALQWKTSRMGLIIGSIVGFLVGFEPVWAGQYVDHMYPGWPLPIGVLLLVVLTGTVWHPVRQATSQPLLIRAQVVTGIAVGLAVGGALGFGATLEWLTHFVVPPTPGHIGYLPNWPWDAVSWPLTNRILPVLLGMVLWVAAIGAAAVKRSPLDPNRSPRRPNTISE